LGASKATRGMSFRDFTCFNKALLTKQSWRLWNQPNSFMAKIMKAKYYPESSILKAWLGWQPSFAWRNFHSSCDLLNEGLIWRVGNGSSIRIWKDKWLPSPNTYSICSAPVVLDSVATVNELIDGETKWWNTRLLEVVFSSEDVKLIQVIPPSCSNQKDTLI
jgi:hypothetical protein